MDEIVRDTLGKSLRKSGPYIGPKGGKWADPAHKIPWTPERERAKRGREEEGKEHRERKEKEAEEAVLAHVRKQEEGIVMRTGAGPSKGKMFVLDVLTTEPDPDAKYDWQKRAKRIAEGTSWREVARKLGLKESSHKAHTLRRI